MSNRKVYRGLMSSTEKSCCINFLQNISEWFAQFRKQPEGGKLDVPLPK